RLSFGILAGFDRDCPASAYMPNHRVSGIAVDEHIPLLVPGEGGANNRCGNRYRGRALSMRQCRQEQEKAGCCCQVFHGKASNPAAANAAEMNGDNPNELMERDFIVFSGLFFGDILWATACIW
ncbi:MAG: hypothetical protein KGQ87_10725, partial [Verrucomicrobia bacterium]|nr:hypothetical protein [Verrucomicrobiota bacterium]